MITTEAITSRKLAAISNVAERVYWRGYMASDNYGTMSGDPWDVWQKALPGVKDIQELDVIQALEDLVAVRLLQRWSVEGKVWIHWIGHDKHQSADWLRKRGGRRTPEPPAITAEADALGAEADAQARYLAPQAVGHQRAEADAHPTTITTTTPTTNTKQEGRCHDADPASWLNSDVTHTPQPTDPMIDFIDHMRGILMDAYQESSAGQLAEAVYRMSAKRGPLVTVYPVEQWMRAAQELVKAIKDGRVDDPSRGAGWIRAAVPTAIGDLDTVDGVGAPAEDPDVVRIREMAARYSNEGAA